MVKRKLARNSSYYKVGGKRLEVRELKVENDNFYLLTLAAVAKELNRSGMRNTDILLSVGLPLTRFILRKTGVGFRHSVSINWN